MLGKAAMRIIRRKWPSVQMLAEELYTIFRKGMTIEPGQIVINQEPGDTRSPIVINQPDDSTVPPITVTRGSTTIDISTGGSGGGGGGGVDLGDIEFPGQDPGQVNLSVPDPGDNPFTLYGQVVSKVGGQVYSVECWAKNPATAPSIGVLQVTAPAVDADDTLPEGYAVLVLAFPGLDDDNKRVVVAAVMCPAVYAPVE